ncbi:hypothetical protein TWF281_002937 [Arthrobotrys megalospora]
MLVNKITDKRECEENLGATYSRGNVEFQPVSTIHDIYPNLEDGLKEGGASGAVESKRPRELVPSASREPPRKRLKSGKETDLDDEIEVGDEEAEDLDPIDHWTKTNRWPEDYARQKKEDYRMSHSGLFRKASNSLRRKRSDTELSSSSPSTPTDQRPRESKNVGYDSTRYDVLLSCTGVFMEESPLGLTEESKKTYQNLLAADQPVPADSLFRDDIFATTCGKLARANEARVMRDITLLIVPSAEILATFGSKHLDILSETCNAGWNSCIPFTNPRPQPDYSVGFKREAFTKAQFNAILPFLGDFLFDQACFMATYLMFFPFLSCEVKCSGQPLEIADRQNAHSMGVAVKGVVELFKLVGRQQELNREILGFSISHDNKSVRIFGHYPVIEGDSVEYYRHPIRSYEFSTNPDIKWTAYKFTKSIYDLWVPTHFKRLCSAIDQIPSGVDFAVAQLSQSPSFVQGSGSASVRSDSQYFHTEGDAHGEISPGTSFAAPLPKKARNEDPFGQV